MIGRRTSPDRALPQRLDALRSAVDLAEGRLDEATVAFARSVIDKAEERLRHGSTHTLVALLGATGSGKSSMANALVGSEIATTGVRRPTTSSTLACVWGGDDAQPLLDWLEVANRHMVAGGEGLDGLVVLDVPDHDSVEVSHRLEMERIAEHADLLVWITDPEKYADAALHRYLRQLSDHGAVTAVVLNKIDLLAPDDLETCRRDLARLLLADGIDNATVLTTSTTTGVGLADLARLLREAVERQDAVVERLSADVTVAADDLLQNAGPRPSSNMTEAIGARLRDDLAGAAGIDAVAEAVAAGHRRDASTATGWPFTRWVGRLRPHPLRRLRLDSVSTGRSSRPQPSAAQRVRSEAAIRDAADAATKDLEEPWPTLVRNAATPDPDVLADRLDQAVAESVRDGDRRSPRWWSVVGLVQMLLAVTAVLGAAWLAIIAIVAWLQLPDLPTPELASIPVPTGMLVIGAVAGWLLAVISRQIARAASRRRANRAKKRAANAVAAVADDLVIDPISAELSQREELLALLTTALADRRRARARG